MAGSMMGLPNGKKNKKGTQMEMVDDSVDLTT